MGVLTAVVNVLSPDEETAGDDSFGYRCVDCDAEFRRPKRQMTRVRCPDCGSPDVRSAG
ncbi:hydrogenase maturation nickel metallochaperone HypA [Halogeometricum limi]|uniref:Zinc ribbon domain-containing protein n=1 Tax=Halogeometricum limi TaxID=555875 RepID=A0A1I6GQ12_9EURY|nr:hydrogenase maturation nickel metallochaperone HypA [Halogeometricum limi]SFR44280.1 hypothetical protein SAMN04488124_1379 [Halogeometricum limi]